MCRNTGMAAAIVIYLQKWISPFPFNKKLFTVNDSERAFVIAFNHRFLLPKTVYFTFSAFSDLFPL